MKSDGPERTTKAGAEERRGFLELAAKLAIGAPVVTVALARPGYAAASGRGDNAWGHPASLLIHSPPAIHQSMIRQVQVLAILTTSAVRTRHRLPCRPVRCCRHARGTCDVPGRRPDISRLLKLHTEAVGAVAGAANGPPSLCRRRPGTLASCLGPPRRK
jgi:hypothetical protein